MSNRGGQVNESQAEELVGGRGGGELTAPFHYSSTVSTALAIHRWPLAANA